MTTPYTGRVLVTGASGNLGRRVVQQLQQLSIPTKVLVRAGAKGQAFHTPTTEICVGDLKVEADVARAVQGVQAIIHTAGVGLGRGPNTPMAVDYDGTRQLIHAAAQAGIQHIVLISVIGAGWINDSSIFIAKNKAEQELRASSLRYTILRPGGFMSDYETAWTRTGKRGIYIAMGRIDKPLGLISPDDLATLAIHSLWTEAAWNRTFDVTNGEQLTNATLAALYSRLFNKPITMWRVPVFPLQILKLATRPLNPNLSDFLGFLVAVGREIFAGESTTVEQAYNLHLERHADYLERTRPTRQTAPG